MTVHPVALPVVLMEKAASGASSHSGRRRDEPSNLLRAGARLACVHLVCTETHEREHALVDVGGQVER